MTSSFSHSKNVNRLVEKEEEVVDVEDEDKEETGGGVNRPSWYARRSSLWYKAATEHFDKGVSDEPDSPIIN